MLISGKITVVYADQNNERQSMSGTLYNGTTTRLSWCISAETSCS